MRGESRQKTIKSFEQQVRLWCIIKPSFILCQLGDKQIKEGLEVERQVDRCTFASEQKRANGFCLHKSKMCR